MAQKGPLLANLTRRLRKNKRPKTQLTPATLVGEVEALGRELSARLEPQAVLRKLSSRLVERYRVAACGIWNVNEDGSDLELVANAGRVNLPPTLRKTSTRETILGRAAHHGLPQVLSNKNEKSDKLFEWAHKNRLGFLATYPLTQELKVQAVLLVACTKSPGPSVLALFQMLARLASVALRDAQLFSSTQRTMNKLSFLVEASKALGSTLDLPELLSRVLEVAQSQVGAERGTLFLVDEEKSEIWSLVAQGLEKQEIRLPVGKGVAGYVAKTGEIVNIPDVYADSRFDPEMDKRTGFRTRNILCMPIRNKAGKIIATLELLNKLRGPFTEEDSDFLVMLSGHMALALENAQLHQALIEKDRMEKEFALARGIQRSLLPDKAPRVEGFDIAILNEPCFEVGGDYYDFLSLGPHTLLVVVADVEGKGVASALVMSNLQAALRSLVFHLHSLNEIAELLNRMILTDTRAERYLSIFLGLIDTRRKAIHYINCGHLPPLVVRADKEPIRLSEGGVVVGLFENAQFGRGQAKLEKGDTIILCTDGITESSNSKDEEFGVERLVNSVRAVAHRKAEEIVAAVSADVARFSRQGTHADDKVMIVIKVLEGEVPIPPPILTG